MYIQILLQDSFVKNINSKIILKYSYGKMSFLILQKKVNRIRGGRISLILPSVIIDKSWPNKCLADSKMNRFSKQRKLIIEIYYTLF